MKFTRLTRDQIQELKISGLKDPTSLVPGTRCVVCWKSNCGHVVIAHRHWNTDKHSGEDNCAVTTYADEVYAVGFTCKLDGSEAFVAEEIRTSLADYKFVDYNSLKDRLATLRLAMAAAGKADITLAQFHKYKERKAAAQ